MENQENKGKHRCLGLNCSIMLPKGIWFCPKCKRKLNNNSNSRVAGGNGKRVIKKEGGLINV